MKKQQSGFTLIELIMVIVVLGILAAFALPKFVNLGGDARAATLQGALASVKSASAMAHSSYLAKNGSGDAVTFEGDVEVAMVEGYPAAKDTATAVGIAEAAGLESTEFQVAYDAAGEVAYISPNGVAVPAEATIAANNCVIVYTEAAAGGVPGIVVRASDCNQ